MAAVQYQSDTVHYDAGQIIALQGSVSTNILFLKKGIVEVKQCTENIKGFLDFEIIEKSKSLKEISVPSILGGEFLFSYARTVLSFDLWSLMRRRDADGRSGRSAA